MSVPGRLLDEAYATLSQGNHDYKGHRVKAMKQIEMAVKELGGQITVIISEGAGVCLVAPADQTRAFVH
jgi:hypothetical protein